MNPEMKTLYDERKMGENNNKRYSSSRTKETVPLSRTIDVNKDRDVEIRPRKDRGSNGSTYEEHLKDHPGFIMKNMRYNSVNLGRSKDRGKKLEKKINNHFIYHMSSEDRKVLCSEGYKELKGQRSSLDQYF